MRRTLIAPLAVLALALAACAGDDTEPEPEAAPETDEAAEDEPEEEVDETEEPEEAEEADEEAEELPTRADADLVIWADDTRTPIIQAIGDEFAEEQGITVAVQQLDFGDIRDHLIVTGPAGEGPDIIIGAHDWLGQLVANAVLAPVELGDRVDDFHSVGLEAFTYEGNLYGLPYALENVALFRNTDLAPEAPSDFEDMAATGLDLVDAGEAELPFALQVGTDGDPYHFYPLFTSFGSSVFAINDDGTYDPDQPLVDSDEGLAFAEALADLADRGVLNADLTFDLAKEAFAEGRAPYTISGPWNTADYLDADIEFVVETIPSLGGETAAPFVGVQGFMISAYAENPLYANDFVLNYLGTEDIARQLFETGQRPPALVSVSEEVQDDPIIAGFAEVGANGQPMPAIPAMASVWEDWGTAQRDIILGVDDPAERMSQAGEHIRAALE
jgi:arabinogalactan oligomer / maltooligosaccharide transport system substrate-binding protein